MPERVVPWQRVSTWALVASNLVPLYGVLFHGWAVFPIMLLFWLENVVIGAFNVLRMIVARPPPGPSAPAVHAAKVFMVPFFCFHYGMFTFVHGIFVFALFGGDMMDGVDGRDALLRAVPEALASWHLGWALLALAASHAVSFVTNYLGRGEYRRLSLGTLLFQPYARVIVLHVAILFGGFLILALGSPTWALGLLVLLKTGVDLAAHLREHARAEAAP